MDFDKTMLERDLTSILRENEKAIDLQDLEEHATKLYNSKLAIDNKIEENVISKRASNTVKSYLENGVKNEG